MRLLNATEVSVVSGGGGRLKDMARKAAKWAVNQMRNAPKKTKPQASAPYANQAASAPASTRP